MYYVNKRFLKDNFSLKHNSTVDNTSGEHTCYIHIGAIHLMTIYLEMRLSPLLLPALHIKVKVV